MANDDTESSRARPASPLKRVENGKGEIRASKRRKVDHGDHPPSTRELAPKPSPAVNDVSILVPSQPSYAKPKTKLSSNKRRATSLNLKNYPSNHHPVAIGVWILQKVEQARKELENQRFESDSSEPPRIGLQGEHLTVDLPPGYTISPHFQPSSVENATVPVGQELEAERLQAQRNRKTKQRQENWAKNKETDVVARAKIESKKHFDALPNASDAEQQAWIEEKIRLDFGRLLDRLAAQLNSEIVEIPLFQIGYADHYFNKATNPKLEDIDDETVSAARLIADVLPALSESVVSHRHQNAAHALVRALAQGAPLQDSFIAAIFMLAQDPQVLLGLDKVLSNIFLPKTGSQLSQLARKRASNGSDLPGSGNGLNAVASSPTAAPVWHWKEPATLANSTRYISQPMRQPAPVNDGFNHPVIQPYHSDYLPPPIVVHAEVYRPPLPPSGYYQQPHQPYIHNRPQGYYHNGYYARPLPDLAPRSNWMNQSIPQGQYHGDWSTPLPHSIPPGRYQQPLNAHAGYYQPQTYQQPPYPYTGIYQQSNYQPPPVAHNTSNQTSAAPNAKAPSDANEVSYQRLLDDDDGVPPQSGGCVSAAISLRTSCTPTRNADASEARTPSEPPIVTLPIPEDRAISVDLPNLSSGSATQSRIETIAEPMSNHSAVLPEVVVISDPAPDQSIRRQSPIVQKTKHSAEKSKASANSGNTVVISDPVPDDSPRRRSSRGTVLTPKAKAAGILLGTQIQKPGQTGSRRVSNTSTARNASKSPTSDGVPPLATVNDESEMQSRLELAQPAVPARETPTSEDTSENTPVAGGIVLRSSGRERRPTAKVLASSAPRCGGRVSDYSSSIPRISSKLCLSHSSNTSIPSNAPVTSKDTPFNRILSSASNTQTSPETAEASTPPRHSSELVLPTTSSQNDQLGQNPTSETEQRQKSIDGQEAYPKKSRRSTITDEQVMEAMVGTNEDAEVIAHLKTSPTKYQKFLTNDKGQGMGQALLMMAHIAVDWIDSDDEDEQVSENDFQVELQRAMDRQLQKSKSKTNAATQSHSAQSTSPRLSLPTTRAQSTPSLAARDSPDVAFSPSISANIINSDVSANHEPTVAPSSGLQNGEHHASTDARSISQITDDFIALVRLKDEAKVHDLPINDWMSLEELTNLVKTHHASEGKVENTAGISTSVPSPSQPATCSGAVNSNRPDLGAAQETQRHRATGSSEISQLGTTNGSRNSTPSTRGASSATPQPHIQTPPIPTFKKGGTVISFGKKAAQTTTVTSARV